MAAPETAVPGRRFLSRKDIRMNADAIADLRSTLKRVDDLRGFL